jgi:hypothetical protein
MIASTLVNPAGGLRYHVRAARYSRKLWQPFRWAVGEWLLGWNPPETTLVIVGPSGGYNLQPFLFERFEKVVALEPDPVARYLFRRRLSRAPLERHPSLEMLSEDHLLAEPERLVTLLEERQACVLFSNVLGQLPVLLDTAEPEAPALARIRRAIARMIEGRSWASFHDRVSGELRPALEGPIHADGRLTDAQILQAFYGEADSAQTSKAPPEPPRELQDHLTEGLFPEALPHIYFSWELEPSVYHLIEGVRAVRAPQG